MKLSNFIKLVSLMAVLSVLPLQASYAGCGCSEPEPQDQRDIDNADPERE